jgi:tetratricopeptide (TPR) repeat protein
VRGYAILLAFASAIACTRQAPAPSPPAGPRSVLLVTVDTLRADRLGCYGDGQARTPVIDALARGGVVFERAYTPVPITLPAHASILTGTLPPVHGVRGNGAFALSASMPTLGTVLQAAGVRTAAFVGAFPVARRFGLDRGFSHYDDAMGKAPGVRYEFPERPATAVVAAARQWLAANPGPVFAWVHLFDPHAPYAPPAGFAQADPYRGEIAAVDAALAPLVADWDARGGGVLALLSDHGEAFGEHGEESHSLFVYDTTLHVPLILRAPGLAPRRVAGRVGITRLAATLLDAAGVPSSLPGRSLLPLARGTAEAAEPLYAETLAPRLDFGWSELRSWRDGRYKYIRAPRAELYDLDADPGETHDLAREQPRQAAALEAALARASAGRDAMARAARPDAETAERLRALGYVQGAEPARASGLDPKDRVDVARAIAGATGPFKDYAQAAAAYAALARRAPEVPVVNLRLADALLRSGRSAEAIAYYERVIAGAPQAADAYVGLATALAERGRLDEAARVLRDGLQVDSTNGQLQYNLGEIARVRGRKDEARARYSAALQDPVTRDRAQQRLRELQ